MVEVTKVLACFPGLTSAHPIVIRTSLHVLVKKNRGTQQSWRSDAERLNSAAGEAGPLE
jgi:hypothetical protein